MTDPTIAYPPTSTPGGEGCCVHGYNMHDRAHCLTAGCECTREAYVLRAQREKQAAEAPSLQLPDGYSELAIGLPLCSGPNGCGSLVGDTELHTRWHAAGQ